MSQFFMYVLLCKDQTFYTGYTVDLKKRIATHNAGKGAKYTRAKLPVELVYFEVYADKVAAMQREYEIKQLTKLEKEMLIDESEDIV